MTTRGVCGTHTATGAGALPTAMCTPGEYTPTDQYTVEACAVPLATPARPRTQPPSHRRAARAQVAGLGAECEVWWIILNSCVERHRVRVSIKDPPACYLWHRNVTNVSTRNMQGQPLKSSS